MKLIPPPKTGPKILVFDIETAPILGYVWQLWDNNLALNQIKTDWSILSWSAKWLNDKPENVMYQDNRKSRNVEKDKKLLRGIWKLLDMADIVVTQNGIKFDEKKLNARFVINKLGKPSPFKHIDTLKLAKKHFAFTSNKLEYMTNLLCVKYKKKSHSKYPGFELWIQCLKRNQDAWKEMEIYNKYDVLSLEELYLILRTWDQSINFDVYNNNEYSTCNCGSSEFQRRGYNYSNLGKYQRYQCKQCHSWYSSKKNILTKDKREMMLKPVGK